MGGAPNTSANLSCLGLKWHANFWEPRSGQLPVGRLTRTCFPFADYSLAITSLASQTRFSNPMVASEHAQQYG